VRLAEVEGSPAHDDRSGTGEGLPRDAPTRLGAAAEHPLVQVIATIAQGVVGADVRTGDEPIQRHRLIKNYPAHAVSFASRSRLAAKLALSRDGGGGGSSPQSEPVRRVGGSSRISPGRYLVNPDFMTEFVDR
jgi:hypothetical protein